MRRFGLAILMVGVVASVAVACGLDENGTATDGSVDVVVTNEGGMDVAPNDVVAPDVQNDVALPPTCSATDVSCLGFDAGVPDGWAPFVIAPSACPAGDYTGSPWQINARLATGACMCGCTASGAYTCPSTITVDTGGNCGTTETAEAGVCTPQNPQSMHMELPNAPTASGIVACAPDASAASAASDPVTLCSIGCDAGAQGLCGQSPGQRCIAADGIQACPNGLVQHIVGSGATATCDPCACKPSAPPTCSASVIAFFGYNQGGYHANDMCQDGGQYTLQNAALNQNCQTLNANYDSFIVNWNALPPTTCTPSASSGDAGLASPKTLCCN
jgi:hypothetical protein